MTTLETCEDGHEAIAFARELRPANMGNTCPLCAMREALSDAKEALSYAEGAGGAVTVTCPHCRRPTVATRPGVAHCAAPGSRPCLRAGLETAEERLRRVAALLPVAYAEGHDAALGTAHPVSTWLYERSAVARELRRVMVDPTPRCPDCQSPLVGDPCPCEPAEESNDA